MASGRARLIFRIAVVALLLLLLFYVGRPLYWKISATVHDIRANKQTVSGGISQFVYDAQRSVGWIRDESDSGERSQISVAARRFLLIRQMRIANTCISGSGLIGYMFQSTIAKQSQRGEQAVEELCCTFSEKLGKN